MESRKTEILFFFDTEDYTSERSCDAVRDLLTLFRREGFQVHVALVGYLARQMVAWDRRDVLEEMRHHVVGTHTLYHSLHPDICELSDDEDFEAAYRRVLAQEAEAIGMIRAATGTEKVLFSTPPGNCKSYVAMYVYSDLGVPFYCDTVVSDERGSDVWYCGARHTEYVFTLEEFLPGERNVRTEDVLNALAARDRAIVYCHPNMAVFREFWDERNYKGENLAEFGKWRPCPPRSAEDTEEYYRRIRAFLRAMREDGRFGFPTLPELYAAQKPRTAIRREDAGKILRHLRERFVPTDEPSWCLADLFQAAAHFLRGESEYMPGLPRGFLYPPSGVTSPLTVRAEDLRKAAEAIPTEGFLPETISVGGAPVGPADFLLAAWEELAAGADEIVIRPKEQLGSMEEYPKLACMRIAGSWVHTPEFADRWLSDRLRLQLWTLRKE